MIKRLLVYFLIILALIYAGSGIYFYKKSFRKKNGGENSKDAVAYSQPDLLLLKEIFNDYENDNNRSTSSEKAYAGKKSFKLESSTEFGAEIIQSFSEIPSLNDLRQIEVSFKNWNVDVEEGTSWVLEINDEGGKIIGWYSEFLPSTLNSWETCTFHFSIKTEFLSKSNHIKTYIWNKNKAACYIDDLRIRFLGINKDNNNTFSKPLNQSSFFFDLENDSSLETTGSISDDVSHSGKRSSFVSGKNGYSVLICKKLFQVMNDTIRTVGESVWLYPLNEDPECTLVFEIRNSKDEQIYWYGKGTAKMNLKAKSWQKLNASFNFTPEEYRKFGPDDRLCIYVFNNNNSKVYADDFEVSYGTIPEPRGDKNNVDMNLLEAASYKFNRYNPPFKISTLQRENINNNNSTWLVNYDSSRFGNLLPDQFMKAGNFTGISNGKDELLYVNANENDIELYYFCNDKPPNSSVSQRSPLTLSVTLPVIYIDYARFIFSGKISFDKNKFLNPIYLTGDFNGDGKEELLIVSGNNSSLYNFTLVKKETCTDNPSGISINEIWSGKLNDGISKMFSGNFSGSKADEILFAESNGHCTFKKFNGKEWSVVADQILTQTIFGKSSRQVSGKFYSTTKDILLSIYSDKNKTHASLIELNGKTISSKPIPDGEKSENIFNVDDDLFPILSEDKKHDDLLSLNKRWRFDMKYISIDKNGFYISSVPEFKGFESDQNPKYYEVSRFVTGRFTGNKTEVLGILRNCADDNFDGKHCMKYDSIPDLPNTIQLYNFVK